jgi:hypothetical protein
MNQELVSVSRRLRLALVLWALLFLFILRVAGQLLVSLDWGGPLPPMQEWYSGLLSYPWLLSGQIVIIILYGKVCLDFTRGAGFFVSPRGRAGETLLIFGALYFASMLVRYIATMARHPERRWMGGSIPIVFHLVLAAFILLVGRDYYVRSRETVALGNPTTGGNSRCRLMSIASLIAGVWKVGSGKSQR